MSERSEPDQLYGGALVMYFPEDTVNTWYQGTRDGDANGSLKNLGQHLPAIFDRKQSDSQLKNCQCKKRAMNI